MTANTTTPATTAYHDPLARRRLIQTIFGRILIYALLLFGAALILIPFFWMVSTSLKTEDQLFVWPPKWLPDPVAFENYFDSWKQLDSIAPGLTFWRIMGNTLFITVLAMFGEMFSAAIVAYGFARFRFKGRDTIFFIMLSTMMIPATLTMVPGFLVWREFGLLNTYDPLTLPALTAWGPAYIFLLRQFFLTIPRDMDDAATVDGANTVQIFFYIMLPMVKPAFLAIGVLAFQGNWNNLQAPLIYLNTTQFFTLILSMQFFQQSLSKSAPKWHYMMAMATMMAAPILLMFFTAQRYFIEGLNVGAVKG
ncbi:MAG: carbohydrate ABC transporter permease [Anaerolineae bacterium]|nr:carbohydrate ABC transporter permease [Anaerolineae bacterium]